MNSQKAPHQALSTSYVRMQQNIEEWNVKNIEVHVNANGYACYDEMDIDYLERRCKAFLPRINFHRTTKQTFPFSFLYGLDAHYMKINKEQYEEAMGVLENEC